MQEVYHKWYTFASCSAGNFGTYYYVIVQVVVKHEQRLERLKNNPFKRLMKKILLYCPPFSGHLNVFRALVSEYGDRFDLRLVITGWTNISPDLSGMNIPMDVLAASSLAETDPALFTLPRTVELLSKSIEIAETFRPDLIVYDFFSLEGYLAGKKLNIPAWCSVPALIGPFEQSEYLKEKLAALKNVEALASLGLRAEDLEMVSDGLFIPGERNLLWSYPALTPANFMKNRKPGQYSFVGNLSKKCGSAGAQKNEERPLVYFSFGTVVMDNLWNQREEVREGLKKFIAALAKKWENKPFDVLFVDRGRKLLPEYPKNWKAVEKADQLEMLSRASLFITHAGGNSFHEAVEKRVPMIAVPFFGDQPLIARQIEALGLGKNLAPSAGIDTAAQKDFVNEALAEKLAESVEKMLGELEQYRERFGNLSLRSEEIAELLAE